MARKIDRLSARKAASLKLPGRHSDGGGLYLAISDHGGSQRRRWVFLFRSRGKLREMGLGSASSVSLAQARQQAVRWRAVVADGGDPLRQREIERAARAGSRTFEEIAKDLVAQKSKGWRNAKVRKQWLPPVQTHAKALLLKPVDQITTEHIIACLEPIWSIKPETAARVRSRIEAVLDAARVRGFIPAQTANPARWKGHLSHLLPKRKRLSRGHHAAMPYAGVPAFVAQLQERPSMAAYALEFTILTASRTSETLGCRIQEIDEVTLVWTVPAKRMKSGREHRVPLSQRALEIVKLARTGANSSFVFPGMKEGKPLSTMSMEMLLRRMQIRNATVHGFRSSFRDWAGECTEFPRELAEAALAHVVGDEVERAYRRGDALSRRRTLMDAWAHHLSPSQSDNSAIPPPAAF